MRSNGTVRILEESNGIFGSSSESRNYEEEMESLVIVLEAVAPKEAMESLILAREDVVPREEALSPKDDVVAIDEAEVLSKGGGG